MSDSIRVFQERLRDEMGRKGVSKFEMHKRTKIARTSIDGYLAGADPGLRSLQKIAVALDCAPWELLKPETVEDRRAQALENVTAKIDELRAAVQTSTPDVLSPAERALIVAARANVAAVGNDSQVRAAAAQLQAMAGINASADLVPSGGETEDRQRLRKPRKQ